MSGRPDVYGCKIVLIGEAAVGKTSLIRRYVAGTFDSNYLTTIGTPASKKLELLSLEEKTKLEASLNIWDIMGNRNLLLELGEAYFNGCRGALAVFDITRPETLEDLGPWIAAARKAEERLPIIVLGNKSDLKARRMVTHDEARNFCRRLKMPYLPTSAKTGLNVEKAFRHMVQDSLKVFAALVTET